MKIHLAQKERTTLCGLPITVNTRYESWAGCDMDVFERYDEDEFCVACVAKARTEVGEEENPPPESVNDGWGRD